MKIDKKWIWWFTKRVVRKTLITILAIIALLLIMFCFGYIGALSGSVAMALIFVFIGAIVWVVIMSELDDAGII